MTYEDLIKQWYQRAIKGKDPFTKFIFIYIAFTSFLTLHEDYLRDRERIINLKNDINAKRYYLSIVRENGDLRKVLLALVDESKRRSVPNLTRENDRNWSGRDGVLNGENDWENLVEYWYRIRNNLFHGQKAPESRRNKRLVNYAFLTLQPLMKNFIDNHLTWKFG